jgi:hypothetical protein
VFVVQYAVLFPERMCLGDSIVRAVG